MSVPLHEQPTLRLNSPPVGANEWPTGGRPNKTIGGAVGRFLLFAFLVLLANVAVSLLVTPTRESLLILGSDARPDQLARGEVGRTDTLLLLTADRAMPHLATLSVPRDLWVPIPGYGSDRINAAYETGGPQTAKQTVSNLLGQRVDRYLVIGIQGVRDVVDALGGVDITVETAIHDAAYPTDTYGVMTVDIPAGPQHMDGETALEYARTRHQDSDFGRTARQQRVVAAVRTALLNPWNWPRVPAVLLTAQRSVKTDINPFDVVAITAAVLRNGTNPQQMVIQPPLVREITGADGAYLLDPTPALKTAVARYLSAGTPLVVEVLNAAGVPGLARSTGDRLQARGFQIAAVANAPQVQSQSSVLVRPGGSGSGAAITSALGIPSNRVHEDSALAAEIDARILVGKDLAP